MGSFTALYNEVEYKLKVAVAALDRLKKENVELKNKLSEFQLAVEELSVEVEDLREENKILTITKTVLHREDKKGTEEKIDNLVREIDRSIKLLSRVEWKTQE